MTYLRLRQICLLAADLDAAAAALEAGLGVSRPYRDPGVGKYGLRNVVYGLGGTFLEVVSPLRPGQETAAGRLLARRGGDCGYMFIVDCDDLERRRGRFQALGARIVEDLRFETPYAVSEAIHLHPRDAGGCLLSIDRHSGGEDLKGGYAWAGPDWPARSVEHLSIAGADIAAADPAAVAARWGELLERAPEVDADGAPRLGLDLGFARFIPAGADGEGLTAVHVATPDPEAALARARAAAGEGAGQPDGRARLVGVDFAFHPAAAAV
jgi:hypothetical protein